MNDNISVKLNHSINPLEKGALATLSPKALKDALDDGFLSLNKDKESQLKRPLFPEKTVSSRYKSAFKDIIDNHVVKKNEKE